MFSLFPFAFLAGSPARTLPELELIGRRATRRRVGTPLLFIHGAYAGAWCWQEHFLDYFADAGFDAYAVSLRGHGGSQGRESLHSYGILDYVEDVRRSAAGLDRPPVLIGHSMGGMVVQKYLERYSAPGAVLMASVPPSGLALSALRLMTTDPALFLQISLAQHGSPDAVDYRTASRALFADSVPDSQLARYAGRFQQESHRAIWDMTVGNLPRTWRIEPPPLLVLGGGQDVLFPEHMVHRTARAYGAEAEILPGMGHAMMLEPDWERVAARLAGWLQTLPLR